MTSPTDSEHRRRQAKLVARRVTAGVAVGAAALTASAAGLLYLQQTAATAGTTGTDSGTTGTSSGSASGTSSNDSWGHQAPQTSSGGSSHSSTGGS
jgi:hypothetical protein